MKYAIVIADGGADEAQESLGGKTPLEAANIPAMDAIAKAGVVGRANHAPREYPAGSEVANMSLLGYDPLKFFTGRAPLEAAGQGIELAHDDWAIRCNLVTIKNQIMVDFSAGDISSEEAAALMKTLDERLGNDRLQFVPGVGYRNLVIYRGAGLPPVFSSDTRGTAPHDLADHSVLDDYPRGPGSDLLMRLMTESGPIFADHPVNLARRAAGKPPATNIWLWGLGGTPKLAPFAKLHGKSGAMITAIDLLRGLGKLIGWRRIDVPGANGGLHTDFAAKARYAIAALKDVDVVCVHVEAPDAASHKGDVGAKVRALEDIDRHIVGPVHEALKTFGDYRVLVSPDHHTALKTKTHAHPDVPFTMAGAGVVPDNATVYDDPTANRSSLAFDEGWRLMGYFLGES